VVRQRGTPQFSTKTAWARNLAASTRHYLQTEIGGAMALLAATLVALVWANAAHGSYESVWTTQLSVRVGGAGVAQDLRHWVNDGLMTLFFFVVGLEARREFDLGELRERRRIALPVLAALGGMAVPVAIYLAFNAGHPSAHGWGAAMSTDTAFALGVLVLVAPPYTQRLRVFLLSIVVIDDLVALAVIVAAYTGHVSLGALGAALGLFALVLALRSAGVRRGIVYFVVGTALWVAVFKSGIEPVIVGLAMGLLAYAYPAARLDLDRAAQLFRAFREQPTPELARSARLGVDFAISANERLQQLLHPWTSYAIVPLFALANVGIMIDGVLIKDALTSPVTLGIFFAYVVGKPMGILAASWLGTRTRLGGLRLPVTWPGLAGAAVVAGIGFTVSLLIATLAFHGRQLEEAKLGILAAAVSASLLGWLVFTVIAHLPPELRQRQLAGTAEEIVDLAAPVDPERDHIRGPDDAPVTVVEYGDFECPNCGQAEPVVRELLVDFGHDLRYVFRHLPLSDVHPRAQVAAEASEAADEQGAFWPMHDLLFEHQDALGGGDLVGYAEQLGLDTERFEDELRRRVHAGRVGRDVDDADLSGVSGTPTFFVNGRRHNGAYDIETLSALVRSAYKRALGAEYPAKTGRST
jgi:Na+/H+ antiporter NhaA